MWLKFEVDGMARAVNLEHVTCVSVGTDGTVGLSDTAGYSIDIAPGAFRIIETCDMIASYTSL